MCDRKDEYERANELARRLTEAQARIVELQATVADQAMTLRLVQPHPFRPDQDDLLRCGRHEDDPIHRVATIEGAGR